MIPLDERLCSHKIIMHTFTIAHILFIVKVTAETLACGLLLLANVMPYSLVTP
jgi:hypothetical protein